MSQLASIASYVADCMFTHFVIATLIIIMWRSLWNILNTILQVFEDPVTGHWVSVGIGYASAIILFSLEELFAKVCLILEAKGSYYGKIAWEDFVIFITLLSNVFIWRGAWELDNVYVIQDTFLGGWVNLCAGTFLLSSLQLLSFVGACGVALDGDCRGREAIYPTHYLRVLLKSAIDERKASQVWYIIPI